MCDDLFEDAEADELLLERSWKKTITDINTEGYREGVDAGREESVQKGFNEAFALATCLLYQVAQLRGMISGKLSATLLKAGLLKRDKEKKLQDLLQEVCLYESELLMFSQERLANLKMQTVSVDTSTESTEDSSEEISTTVLKQSGILPTDNLPEVVQKRAVCEERKGALKLKPSENNEISCDVDSAAKSNSTKYQDTEESMNLPRLDGRPERDLARGESLLLKEPEERQTYVMTSDTSDNSVTAKVSFVGIIPKQSKLKELMKKYKEILD